MDPHTALGMMLSHLKAQEFDEARGYFDAYVAWNTRSAFPIPAEVFDDAILPIMHRKTTQH